MKKIIGLSIAALLIIGIVAVGTYAYFSDTATSTGNTWTAGTLVLSEVTLGASGNTTFTGIPSPTGGINGSVQFGPVVPGSSGTVTWTLNNTGTLPGTLTMPGPLTVPPGLTNIIFNENPPENAPEHAADATDAIGLGQRLMVWVTRNGSDVAGWGTTLAYVPMSGLAGFLTSELPQTIAPSGSLVYVLHWQVPTSVGNEIQGDSANLDITFLLSQ